MTFVNAPQEKLYLRGLWDVVNKLDPESRDAVKVLEGHMDQSGSLGSYLNVRSALGILKTAILLLRMARERVGLPPSGE